MGTAIRLRRLKVYIYFLGLVISSVMKTCGVWCDYYFCNQPGGELFAAIALAVGMGKTPQVP